MTQPAKDPLLELSPDEIRAFREALPLLRALKRLMGVRSEANDTSERDRAIPRSGDYERMGKLMKKKGIRR